MDLKGPGSPSRSPRLGKTYDSVKPVWQKLHRENRPKWFQEFLAEKVASFFLIVGQRCQIWCQKIRFFKIFRQKKIVLRCPKLIWIAKREASHSKIMFYRDTQTLAIHISRGTCTRGDIVIHITFALAQHISQRGFKKVILIVAYLIERCCLGTIWIANEFGLSRYIVFFCAFNRHIFCLSVLWRFF